ncbi:MAG: hypothetical protein ACR2IV_22455 [Bryobacteraceae bacterium]
MHSFWVPNLHGKRDLIPSRITTEWIQADTPGVYRGQCAEFCGPSTRTWLCGSSQSPKRTLMPGCASNCGRR